jgi:hypothetical protein
LTKRNRKLYLNPREVPLAPRLLLGLKEKVSPPKEEEVEEAEEDAQVLLHVLLNWTMKLMNHLKSLLRNLEEAAAKNPKFPLPKK